MAESLMINVMILLKSATLALINLSVMGFPQLMENESKSKSNFYNEISNPEGKV